MSSEKIVSRKVILFVAGMLTIASAVYGYRAWANRITPEKVAAGKILFEHEWSVNDPLTSGDGLGPVFNARSCVACHFQGGTGGAGPNQTNVTTFTVLPTEDRPNPITGVIHADAIVQPIRETLETLKARFPIIRGGVETIESSMDGCGAYQQTIPDFDPIVTQGLNAPALFGLSEIERIPNHSIILHATSRTIENIANDFRGGVSGNAAGETTSRNGTTGRFGWKGQHGTIEDFVAQACAVECGLSTRMRKQDKPGKFTEDRQAKVDLSAKQFHELVCFVRALPRPKQILPKDPEQLSQVQLGESLFQEIGCAQCHVPDMGGVKGIYSDFNLYNLTKRSPNGESGYGSSSQKAELPSDFIDLDKWKTPPLWGVADTAPYMHDGSAGNLHIAIDMHHRDAKASRELYHELGSTKRKALIAFLKTLRSPYAEPADESH